MIFACKTDPLRLLNLLILLGAVISGRRFRNPVSLAKKIMYDSPHCALSGDGALKFAMDNNFPICEPDELISQQARQRPQVSYKDTPKYVDYMLLDIPVEETLDDFMDTVSAVALDVNGHFACATSTGKFGKSDKCSHLLNPYVIKQVISWCLNFVCLYRLN